jgi:hypothetical protein
MTSPGPGERYAGSPGRAHRRRSPWSPAAGQCTAPRCGSFWGKLRVGAGGPGACTAPAHLLGPQDPPDLAASHLDAGLPGHPSEGIQRPLRRALLLPSGQLPGPIAHQPPRRHRAGQRDDRRPLRLGDPPLASRTGPVTEPVDAVGVEPVQPAARRVLMAANLAATAGTPSPSQLSATTRARSLQSAGACRAPASRRAFLASPSSCGGHALKNFGTGLASIHLADAPAAHNASSEPFAASSWTAC